MAKNDIVVPCRRSWQPTLLVCLLLAVWAGIDAPRATAGREALSASDWTIKVANANWHDIAIQTPEGVISVQSEVRCGVRCAPKALVIDLEVTNHSVDTRLLLDFFTGFGVVAAHPHLELTERVSREKYGDDVDALFLDGAKPDVTYRVSLVYWAYQETADEDPRFLEFKTLRRDGSEGRTIRLDLPFERPGERIVSVTSEVAQQENGLQVQLTGAEVVHSLITQNGTVSPDTGQGFLVVYGIATNNASTGDSVDTHYLCVDEFEICRGYDNELSIDLTAQLRGEERANSSNVYVAAGSQVSFVRVFEIDPISSPFYFTTAAFSPQLYSLRIG